MSSPTMLYRVASTVVPSDVSEPGGLEETLHKDTYPEILYEILYDVKPFSNSVRSDPRTWFLVEQVKQIGSSAFWGNDCISECNKRQGWHLNIIAQPRGVGDEVFGFMVFKVDSQQKVLHIQYIAVAQNHRRRGIGSKLIKTLQQYATKALTRATVEKICCAVVPEAVEFYQRHNFRKGKRILPTAEEAIGKARPDGRVDVQLPLQFHMEWKVPVRKRK
jgi:GNAT superfamily N-acetyltransferase